MLSGLTSQFGNLMGKKTAGAEGAPADPAPEDGSAPVAETAKESPKDDQASSSVGAEATSVNPANILSSVRNHIPTLPGWLSGKKAADDSAAASGPASPPAPTSPVEKTATEASTAAGGEDDATKAIEEGEAAGGTAALDKVKNLGGYLFSSVKGVGQKIKDTQSMLGDFQKEHESFLKTKLLGKSDNALAPWVGHQKEEELKEEILSLSNDRRNFVRSPPQGVNFPWDWNEYAPVAKAILKDDPNLEQMRYQLVPKVINEESFWRNYFYRVQLLKESMDDTKPKTRRGSSSGEEEGADDPELERELNEELKSFEVVGGSKTDEKEIDSLLDLK